MTVQGPTILIRFLSSGDVRIKSKLLHTHTQSKEQMIRPHISHY